MSHKDYTQYSNKNVVDEPVLIENEVDKIAPVDEVIEKVATEVVAEVIEEPVVEVAEEPVAEVTEEPIAEPVEEEMPEPLPKVVGVVAGCVKLNVRQRASGIAPVLVVIPEGSPVEVFPAESTNEFYKICTEFGAEGYCMKKFIKVDSK